MLLIGLTGSIATGKSTVSSLLAAAPYNLPVIDADKLARQVVEPGTPGYKKIVAHFGPSTPDLLLEDGSLNRPALGRRVFGDDADRQRDRSVLNGIVHPAVRHAMYRALTYSYLSGAWAVVVDVPLLFESKLDVLCGTVMVVAVRDPAVQMARLRARDAHLTEEDARNRVRSQGDVRDKARRCEARNGTAAAAEILQRDATDTNDTNDTKDATITKGIVLWNDTDRAALEKQIQTAMARLQKQNPPWWHTLLLACPPLGLTVAAWTYWQNTRINKAWAAQEKELRSKI